MRGSKKRWRKVLLYVGFVIFNAVVIIATAVNEFGNAETAAELSEVKINWGLLVPATACFVAMIGLEYAKYALMLKKMSRKGTWKRGEEWKVAFQTVMLGRYYDRITPASVGGQPFQIYNIHKTGKVSNGLAAAVPIFSMIAGQATFLVIAVPCFLFGGLMETRPALLGLAWIGLLFYAFWPVMVAGAAWQPKLTMRVIKFGARVLAKMRIIKNREKAMAKIEKEVGEYVESVKTIAKTPEVFWGVLGMSLLSNLLILFVPFFVLEAFGGEMDFLQCLVLSTAVSAAVYFVPTPGNAGAAEGTFYVVFSALSSGYVFWAMMFWRLYSYYIYIIVGPLIYLQKHLQKRKKSV